MTEEVHLMVTDYVISFLEYAEKVLTEKENLQKN
jgi:hypothetical protein